MLRVLEGRVGSCGYKSRKKERGGRRDSSSGMEAGPGGCGWWGTVREAEPQAPPKPSTCPKKASEQLDFRACEGPPPLTDVDKLEREGAPT